MKCPLDDTVLQMTDRNGIEIDYCPQCRGVWLDRGELDKIIDRSVGAPAAPQSSGRQQPPPQQQQPQQQQPQQQAYPPQYDQRYYKKKRKESFLGELFDF
ncbi:MAG TPA: zf-TFIIB domain-containing protein [Nocardioidaceae bacterium]|nr:zf-TFIIB domain-containing protein [Nocardioidaceae bacterium]